MLCRIWGPNEAENTSGSRPLGQLGGEENEQYRATRCLVPPLFFYNYETASFWLKRAVSFKSGARTRQVSNQPLIIFFSSIASLPISVSAPLVGRVFHFSPWPLFYAIEPLIDQ